MSVESMYMFMRAPLKTNISYIQHNISAKITQSPSSFDQNINGNKNLLA